MIVTGPGRGIGVEFAKEKFQTIRNAPAPNQCVGTATLYINGQKVGEYKDITSRALKNHCSLRNSTGDRSSASRTIGRPCLRKA
jgi:hypothetical protein